MKHEKEEHKGKMKSEHRGKHHAGMTKKEHGFGAKMGKKRGDGLEGPHGAMKK